MHHSVTVWLLSLDGSEGSFCLRSLATETNLAEPYPPLLPNIVLCCIPLVFCIISERVKIPDTVRKNLDNLLLDLLIT